MPDATPRPDRPSVLVIVPTFNERDNLRALAPAVLRHRGVRLLIVDDQSPDGTGEVADALAREHAGRMEVVHRTGKRGLGRSYAEAIEYAMRTDHDLIVQMDADFSHDPEHLPAMIAAASTVDLVIGSRYRPGGRIENWSLVRRVLSASANRYIRLVTGLRLHDCTSGYRCWRREALLRLPKDYILADGYSFLVEMLYEAVRNGLSTAEVPITFVERRAGESKLSLRVLIESALTPWRLRRRPLRAHARLSRAHHN
ncbi:MAG TPA: polyprenol monophosphomannose synthase [Vicinamibacterales bacterium]